MAVIGWLMVGAAFLMVVAAVNGSWVTLWQKLTTAEGGATPGGIPAQNQPITVSNGGQSGAGSIGTVVPNTVQAPTGNQAAA